MRPASTTSTLRRHQRLGLLRELVPKAVRIALLVNPANPAAADAQLRDVQDAARAIGLQIQVLKASSSREIEAALATLARERPDGLFVGADGFFSSRRVQFATLTVRHAIPTTFSNRDYVDAGGLMSYGTSLVDMSHHVGVYAGRILKGTKPSDLPVTQPTKFEFVLNMQTARALGLDVPPGLLAIADEVIE
jgi:putative ABC transport system substrate-binding protein